MTKKLPKPIMKEEFDQIMTFMKEYREEYRRPRKKTLRPKGIRAQQCMIAFVLSFGAGLRISEIAGLKKKQHYVHKNKDGTTTDKIIISNIPKLTPDRIEQNYIRVVGGKGKKDRQVPLPGKLLIKWGISRKELLSYLPLKISRRYIQDRTSEVGKEVLKKHISFHGFRHGFATHCLEQGLDIVQVQMFLGHARLDTTGIYFHVNPQKALDKYQEVF